MIRLRKPVRLLEWGEGTNTTNQIWTVVGEGKIAKSHAKAGLTTLEIELGAPFNRKNTKDNTIKLVRERAERVESGGFQVAFSDE